MIASLKQDGVDDVILEGHPQRAFDLEGAYRHVVVGLSLCVYICVLRSKACDPSFGLYATKVGQQFCGRHLCSFLVLVGFEERYAIIFSRM